MSGRSGAPRMMRCVAALLAMMVQLAVGAMVPRTDAVASVLSAQTNCHADDESTGGGAPAPVDPASCLSCPLCVVLHAAPLLPITVSEAPGPSVGFQPFAHDRPPATAPPSAPHTPRQPRAPPVA